MMLRNNILRNHTDFAISVESNSHRNKIFNNVISNSRHGIRISGNSSFNNISRNNITNGNTSIALFNGSKNNVSRNSLRNASIVSIQIGRKSEDNSFKNYIYNNSMTSPKLGLRVYNAFNNNISNQTFSNGSSYINKTYGEVNLTGKSNWSKTPRKISSIVKIERRMITINTTAERDLNRNATLRFFTTAAILRLYNASETRGRLELCRSPRCGALIQGGTTKGFNVTKWSSYALGNISISLDKTADTTTASHGNRVTYTILVTNNANHTENFTINDFLPPNVTFVSSSPSSTQSGRKITFPKKNATSRATYRANITVEIGNPTVGSKILNFANVTVHNGTGNVTINTTFNVTITASSTTSTPQSGGGGSGYDSKYTTAIRDIYEIPYPVERGCNELWLCDKWKECFYGKQHRECRDINKCNTYEKKPNVENDCEIIYEKTVKEYIKQFPRIATKYRAWSWLFALIIILILFITARKLKIKEKILIIKNKPKVDNRSELSVSKVDEVFGDYDKNKLNKIKNIKMKDCKSKSYEEKVKKIDSEIKDEEKRLRKLKL